MTSPFLACRGVSKRFGSVVAVDGVDFAVEAGHVTALLGPSGCGKTTLLRLIAGFEAPDAGEIELAGRLIASPTTFVPPERRKVSMVFQDFALFPHLNVGANVAFGLPKGGDRHGWGMGRRRARRWWGRRGGWGWRRRVEELLALVRLEGLESRMPHELSGGQQQRVALARALAAEPDLVLLDEPFSNLDPAVRADVRREVRGLIRSIGITAVIVTHDQEEALSLAGQVAVMMEGRILQAGSPAELYSRPASRAVAEFVGAANLLRGEARGGRVVCELGAFEHDAGFSGPADVMVRAEDLYVSSEGGVPAEVTEVEYYGHDQVVTVRLASGTSLRVRLLAAPVPDIGARVRVGVRGPIAVFERPAGLPADEKR